MNKPAGCFDSKFTVHIVDDDPDVRDALGLLLQLHGFRTALFDSAEAFLPVLDSEPAGCLITDIRMPGISGLELQKELAARGVTLPVIVLTAHGDIATARTALRSHAVDFLTKPFREAELLAAIELAFERERVRIAQGETQAADQALIASLTPREREVAALIATGAQNVEIARHLGISARTVEIHKARCIEKLRARSVADVVRLADRAGLQVRS